jgi:hypothetical protein
MEKKPVESELGTQKRKLSIESDTDSASHSSATTHKNHEKETNKEAEDSTKNTTEVKKLKIPIKLSLSTTSASKTSSNAVTNILEEKKDYKKATEDLNTSSEKSDSQTNQIKKNLNPKVAQVFGDEDDEDEVKRNNKWITFLCSEIIERIVLILLR